jgi:hypothetical protein
MLSVATTLKLGRCSVGVACATLILASPTFAQTSAAPQPSSGGLFGATRPEAGSRDRLSLTLDVNETLENELPPEFRSQFAPNELQSGGFSTGLTASADYARNRHTLQLAASALTAFRYYPQFDEVDAVSHSASLGASVRLPKQGSLQFSQSIAYSPAYLYALFPTAAVPVPEETIPANPDYRVTANDSYSYHTIAALGFGSERSFRFTTTADYTHSDFQYVAAARTNFSVYSLGAKGSRFVSRNTGLSVEYQYRTGEFGFDGISKEHRVIVGVDYSRALSTKRRATFHFKLTPSTLEVPESFLAALVTDAVPGAANAREYLLQGEAGVDYAFRPGWHVGGNFSRGVEYLPLLSGPVFTDAARAQLTGLITRKMDLSAVAGYATGASAVYVSTQDLETRNFDVKLRYGLKRSLAVYTQYLYYYYDLRGQARLALGQPSVFGEHAVRLGFTLFVEPLRR